MNVTEEGRRQRKKGKSYYIFLVLSAMYREA